MSARCTGHCCRRFFLDASPKELEAMRERSDARIEEYKKRGHFGPSVARTYERSDEYMVPRMVIHVESVPSRGWPGRPFPTDGLDHFYTCKHHDAITGDCKAYAQRPAMCRDYPYGHACAYSDCTMTPHRHERLSIVQEQKEDA